MVYTVTGTLVYNVIARVFQGWCVHFNLVTRLVNSIFTLLTIVSSVMHVLIGLSSERPMVMHAVKTGRVSNLVNGPVPWNVPPQCWHLMEILENVLFHVLYNDACKFAINLFPITWGPFENVNLLYFLLKIQISNGCNVLIIAENPIKDINLNLSFLSSGSKVVKWTPLPRDQHGKNFWLQFLSIGSKVVEYILPPTQVSGGNFGKSTFSCTVQWCMQICHKPFPHHMRAIWKC